MRRADVIAMVGDYNNFEACSQIKNIRIPEKIVNVHFLHKLNFKKMALKKVVKR